MNVYPEDIALVDTDNAATYAKVDSSHKSSQEFISQKITEITTDVSQIDAESKTAAYKVDIVWINVIGLIVLHLWGAYGLKLAVFDVSWLTVFWSLFMYLTAGLGITAGAHRLWCHRSFSATIPLQLYLCYCNCVAFQNCIYDWARDHRVHHKYSDTNADPYNAKRGFFFCHLGWLMCKKHPEVLEKGKGVDVSDLKNDPIVMFQRRYYLWLGTAFCMYLPAAIPYYLWGEDIWDAFFVCFGLRFIMVMHAQLYINSGAHMWGNKPYDKAIDPVENFWASIFAAGEGFHNFHHTFPWDYAASEWGWNVNPTTMCIDLWARMGLAYNLKQVSQDIVNRRRELKGDGSKVWYPEVLEERQKAK